MTDDLRFGPCCALPGVKVKGLAFILKWVYDFQFIAQTIAICREELFAGIGGLRPAEICFGNFRPPDCALDVLVVIQAKCTWRSDPTVAFGIAIKNGSTT